MCEFQLQELSDHRGQQMVITSAGKRLTFQEVARRWQTDARFAEEFNRVLAACPYQAYRWELPGLTASGWTQAFECVLVESLELRSEASSVAFQEHLAGEQPIVTFANLRGDATLVVPAQIAEAHAYPHLAAFVRDAPPNQRHALWETVGKALQQRISTKPVWLSTAGAGVPWLHVRLDDRPKYYRYAPYRTAR